MAIEVSSSNWTGDTLTETGPTRICGEFREREQLDAALSRLEGSLFQRADLSVRVPGHVDPQSNSGSEAPVREDDARNLRQLGVGTAAAAAALAAAGVVVATGGTALPAVVAAASAGTLTAAAGEAAGAAAAAPGGIADQQKATGSGGALLMVHAETPEKQARAEELLRECGAVRVWRETAPA